MSVPAPAAESRAAGLGSHRAFRVFWGADTVSQFGTYVGNTVLPLVAATTLAATPMEMGLLGAAETAGYLLIGLPAGVWVARARQRRLMRRANFARAALMCTIPLAWWCGVLSVSQLVVVALLCGVCAVLFDVAYQSHLPVLVDRDRLLEGNAKLQSSQSLAQITGPGIGGTLVQLAGPALPVAGSALGQLVAALLLGRVREPDPAAPAPAGGPPLLAEIREGLRFTARVRTLRAITACTATTNLFSGVLGAVQVFFLTHTLGLSDAAVGATLSVVGVGGVLGALTAHRVVLRVGQARAVWLIPLTTFPWLLLVPLAGPHLMLAPALAGLFVTGYGYVVYNVAQVSYRQAACREDMLARVNATVRFMGFGALTAGALAGGALGGLLGIRATLWIAAVGTCLSAVWVLCSPLRGMRDFTPPDATPDDATPPDATPDDTVPDPGRR
ncbi:MFS transporter [Streptomyces sp. NBC_00654]|uniref:MFS transporter n=1 Tax=Streptomyces sp. NBC_00654 TaxID=2975799 RepID=UPI002257B2BE|nr:MFS transporter [Streptomyces sp. NBC_00654]MCX4970693.1 MFS transporter [Streptomyces sp. NBC_00654]